MVNFARAWRPTRFHEVIGQDLTIRLLSNSLYRDRLFPVYIFAGQRGCGKTTLARLFAAAINCAQLPTFRNKPHDIPLPCAICSSCKAIRAGEHPDFIEIDAASHTGVDTVRTLIEGATLSPQLGCKKVYLIDEAHMLSKAAFNAFLKTLEEPPHTALFILATTDVHKILDTVRSRAFQLFLSPLTVEQMVESLSRICEAEGMTYEHNALHMLACQAEGSLRDAINQVERALIAYGRVIASEITTLIGTITSSDVIELIRCVGAYDIPHALEKLKREPLLNTNPLTIWRLCYELLRAILWKKYDATSPGSSFDEKTLQELCGQWSTARLIRALDILFEQEQLVMKTAHPSLILEAALVRLCHKEERLISPQAQQVPVSSKSNTPGSATVLQQAPSPALSPQTVDVMEAWIQGMKTIVDPLELSLTRQAQLQWQDPSKQSIIQLELPASATFLQDIVNQASERWTALLSKNLNKQIDLIISYAATPPVGSSARNPTSVMRRPAPARTPSPSVDTALIEDETTKKILRVFQGKVTRGPV